MTHKSPRRIVDGVSEKECTACKSWLPETGNYFYTQGDAKFASECKPCTRDRLRKPAEVRPIAMPVQPATSDDFERFTWGLGIVQTFSQAHHALHILTSGWGRAAEAPNG